MPATDVLGLHDVVAPQDIEFDAIDTALDNGLETSADAATTVDFTPELDPVTGCLLNGTAMPEGTLLITEFMFHPLSSPTAEWFEVANRSNVAIPLGGMSFVTQGPSAAEEAYLVPGCDAFVVPALGTVVFAREADGIGSLPASSWVYGDHELGDTGGSLGLRFGSHWVDKVAWKEGDPAWGPLSNYDGKAVSLDPAKFSRAGNDPGSAWCPAVEAMANGDYGSPGTPNPECLVTE
jgi:hypothetical protein